MNQKLRRQAACLFTNAARHYARTGIRALVEKDIRVKLDAAVLLSRFCKGPLGSALEQRWRELPDFSQRLSKFEAVKILGGAAAWAVYQGEPPVEQGRFGEEPYER